MIPYANYTKFSNLQTAVDPVTGIPVDALARNSQNEAESKFWQMLNTAFPDRRYDAVEDTRAQRGIDTTTDSARLNALRSNLDVDLPADRIQLARMSPEQAAAAGLGAAPKSRSQAERAVDNMRQNNARSRAAQVDQKAEADAAKAKADAEAAAKANPVTATPDRSMMQYLVNPTDNQYANYGIAGGLGALALGGLGGLLFSEPKNRMRNTLLYALLGGGLGLGAKYMADRYGVGAVPAAPGATPPTTT